MSFGPRWNLTRLGEAQTVTSTFDVFTKATR